MLDGGSNITLIVEEGAARLLALRPAVGSIAGIASGLGYTHRGVGECELGPQGVVTSSPLAPGHDADARAYAESNTNDELEASTAEPKNQT